MIPFPIMSTYGNVLAASNTIITFLEKSGEISTNLINDNPDDYFSASYNAILFSDSNLSRIQYTTSGVPSSFVIQDDTDFTIDTYVKFSTTQVRLLCGNLRNSAGTGSYWVTLNNTFGEQCQVSIDGYSTTGVVQRFRFGTVNPKLAVDTWNHVVISRIGTVLEVVLNDISLGTQSMPLGFSNSSTNLFTVGNSSDFQYNFNGTMDSFIISTKQSD